SMALECLAIGNSLWLPHTKHLASEIAQELHSDGVIVASAIPLNHRELRIVQRTALAAAEGSRDLINGRRAGSQQPLHAEFGRGLQPQSLALVRLTRVGKQRHG